MGFSLENIVDDSMSYAAPDRAFISSVSGMVHGFPWERFEHFFESRPLIQASATDQVFLLRVLAVQELLCLDDDSVLRWLKNQMYLLAFLSPGFKPKVPTKALLNSFRDKLQDANLLEPFRTRCENIILKQNSVATSGVESGNYMEAFAPSAADLSDSGMLDDEINAVDNLPDILLEDKWVICPQCESSALHQVEPDEVGAAPKASCEHCGHQFNV
ncbi:MAG: hypothetical protein ACPG47_09750 [Leucothrix sp.]